jgi:methionyl-tRNA formyltransferase
MNSSIKEITIIVSSSKHPINAWIDSWVSLNFKHYNIDFIRNSSEAKGGDLCFLISCNEIIQPSIVEKYKKVLLIHASDLPSGRGWSPHIWTILEGGEEISISLLEASEKIDRGDIWHKLHYEVPKYFLYNDIINIINSSHIELINFAIKNFNTIKPSPQDTSVKPTYYRKRSQKDSKISETKSISEQFDNIRICDYERFPAFFELYGKKFKIKIEHYDEENDN